MIVDEIGIGLEILHFAGAVFQPGIELVIAPSGNAGGDTDAFDTRDAGQLLADGGKVIDDPPVKLEIDHQLMLLPETKLLGLHEIQLPVDDDSGDDQYNR